MKIDFEFETKYGVFKDALNLPDDHGLSDAELEVMKQQRVDNWIAYVEIASTDQVAEPTTEPPLE